MSSGGKKYSSEFVIARRVVAAVLLLMGSVDFIDWSWIVVGGGSEIMASRGWWW